MNNQMPLAQAKLFLPMVDFLEERAHSPFMLLKRYRLNKIDFRTLDYLPAYCLGSFVSDAASITEEPELAYLISKQSPLVELHPDIERKLDGQICLLKAVIELANLSYLQCSHMRIWLNYDDGLLNLHHTSALSPNAKGYEQANLFTTFKLISLIRRYMGEEWNPRSLCFSHSSTPSLAMVNETSSGKVHIQKPFNALPVQINLDRELDQCISRDDLFSAGSEAAWQRVVTVIDIFLEHEALSISMIAQLFGVSERTIQRLCSDHGVSFRELLLRKKMVRAKRLLLAEGQTVSSVAQRLNYNDPSNFTRAFKRLTQLSPKQFIQSGS